MATTSLDILIKTIGATEADSKVKALSRSLGALAAKQRSFTQVSKQYSGAVNGMAKATDKAGNAADRAAKKQEGYFYHIAKTTIQSALINKLFLEMVDVMGKAVTQVDALNNFPKTMASMGQSAEDANQAMGVLRDYVGLIGADLGEATSMVTRFTGALNSVKSATLVYQGINNALIAGDTTAEERTNALIQFSQALERGKPDIREWNTLTQSMAQQLNLVAVELGYASAINLGEALRDGQQDMVTFIAEFTKLSTGTGIIAQQAQTRLNGLQFAFNVMKNTMIQGVAAIVNAFGRANIAAFFSFLTQVIQVLAGWAMVAVRAILFLINIIRALFGAGPIQVVDDVGSSISGVGETLDDAAGSADDLGDGLGGASKSAKELAKSLAPFDKMNVLPDKDTGSGGGGGGSGGGGAGGGVGGIDPAAIGDLDGLLDGIGDKLKDVSIWAKIFAGFLASLAAYKIGEGIINALDKQISRFKKATIAAEKFRKKLKGLWAEAGEGGKTFGQQVRAFPLIFSNSLSGVAKFLTNPWVLLAAAIAVVIGTLVNLYNTNEDFKKGFDAVWKPIVNTFRIVGDWLGKKIPGWIDGLKVEFNKLMQIPSFAWLVDSIVAVAEWLDDLLDKIGLAGSMWEKFGKIIGGIALVFATIMGAGIIAFIATVAAAVGIVIGVVWSLIEGVKRLWGWWETIWSKINEKAQIVWQNLQDLWDGAVEYFVGIWHGIYDAVIGPLESIGAAFVTMKEGAIEAVTGARDGIVDTFNGLKEDLQGQWDRLKGAWNDLVDSIANSETVDKIKTTWSKLETGLGEQWDRLKDKWSELTTAISESQITKDIISKWDEVKGKLSESWDGLKDKFSDVMSNIFGSSEESADGIDDQWSGVRDLFDTISEKVNNLKDVFSESMDDMKKSLDDFVQPLKDLYNEHIKPVIESFKEWARESEVLKNTLKVIGGVIAAVILAPIALLVGLISAVVVAVLAIGFAIIWVVTKFLEFADYIVSGGLWEDIKNKSAEAWQWLKDKFQEAIDKVKEIFSKIPGWFADRWEDLKDELSDIADWFKEMFQQAWINLTNIFEELAGWFKERWENTKRNLSQVADWFKNKFQEAWDLVKNVWNGVSTWFKDRWQDVKNVFSGLRTWFSNKFREGLDGLKSVFSNVGNWFRDNVVNKILDKFRGIKGKITGFFSGVWDSISRGLKSALNTILRLPLRIPTITVAGKTIGGQTLIPRLARGGVITSPTTALVGEDGAEAVIPLENNTEWIDKLASKINSATGGSGQPVQLTIKIGEEEVANKIIDLINEKTQMSGRNAIYV